MNTFDLMLNYENTLSHDGFEVLFLCLFTQTSLQMVNVAFYIELIDSIARQRSQITSNKQYTVADGAR